MTQQQLFPIILMILNIGASVVYLIDGDIRKAIYWAAACIITASITF